jgi:hypothetical protein
MGIDPVSTTKYRYTRNSYTIAMGRGQIQDADIHLDRCWIIQFYPLVSIVRTRGVLFEFIDDYIFVAGVLWDPVVGPIVWI